MPHIELRNTKYYYEDLGNGQDTIVFGHSLLFNLRMFDDQIDLLRNHYRCVSFDFRGQGNSEVTTNGYDLDTLTEDVAELIEKLNCGPCHFVGFSMGGMVAMRLAYKYHETIKSLILIDTSSEQEPSTNNTRNKLMAWVARNFGLKLIASKVISMFFAEPFLTDPERNVKKKKWKNHFLANDRIGVSRAVKGVLWREGITKHLTKISVPTLIMVGENDTLTTLDKAEIIQKGIKDSELKIIPRAGHMSTVEEPEFVNEMISEFLKKINQ